MAGRGEGGFGECGAEPGVAASGAAHAMPVGARVAARAEPRPAREVTGGGERGHGHADRRDKDLGGPPVDARDGVEVGGALFERRDGPPNLRM